MKSLRGEKRKGSAPKEGRRIEDSEASSPAEGAEAPGLLHVRELAKIMTTYGLSELELENADERVRMVRGGTGGPPAAASAPLAVGATAAAAPTPAVASRSD